MPFPYVPYPIYGTINIASSAGVTVTATNLSTSEQITVTSESDSTYTLDCANFPSGYTDGDSIQITANGGTGTTTIDLTNYPQGRQLDINLPSILTGGSSSAPLSVYNSSMYDDYSEMEYYRKRRFKRRQRYLEMEIKRQEELELKRQEELELKRQEELELKRQEELELKRQEELERQNIIRKFYLNSRNLSNIKGESSNNKNTYLEWTPLSINEINKIKQIISKAK